MQHGDPQLVTRNEVCMAVWLGVAIVHRHELNQGDMAVITGKTGHNLSGLVRRDQPRESLEGVMLVCPGNRLRPGIDANLAEEAGDMRGNRRRADEERLADLPVAFSGHEFPQDIVLPSRQAQGFRG